MLYEVITTALQCADGNNRCTVVIIGRWSGTPSSAATVFAGEGSDVRTEIYNNNSKWQLYAGGSIVTDGDSSLDTNFHAIVWDLDGGASGGGTTPWTVDMDFHPNLNAGPNTPTNGITIAANRYGTSGFADFDYCAIGLYEGVITSYSIHYTKLYEMVTGKWGIQRMV